MGERIQGLRVGCNLQESKHRKRRKKERKKERNKQTNIERKRPQSRMIRRDVKINLPQSHIFSSQLQPTHIATSVQKQLNAGASWTQPALINIDVFPETI